MIDSKTGLIGLIGNPVEHSVSTIFMNYILEKLNINYRYFAIKIDKNQLETAVNGLNVLGFKGMNVTIPYKKDVIAYIGQLNLDVKRIGAVNCILNNKGRLTGFNTDHLGFVWPLREYKGLIKNSNVLLFGCGGASRGVAYSLNNLKIKGIYLVNRSEANSKDFIKWGKKILNPDIKITYIGDSHSINVSILKDVLLVINTTPVGMKPNIEESPLSKDISFYSNNIVYDLIYNPWQTVLLKRADECGAKTINGFPMLIAQGLYSLSIWFPEIKEKVFSIYDEASSFTAKYLIDKNL